MAQHKDEPASISALCTVEILEAILLQLDMKFLLLVPSRVCHFWRNVMQASVRIQQALFFRPVPYRLRDSSSDDVPYLDRMILRPQLNPLLLEKFSPVFFDLYQGQDRNMYRQASSFYALPWTKDPLKEYKHIAPDWPAAHSVEVRPVCDIATRQNDQESRRRFTCAGASWRKMFVSQPPPPHIGVLFPDFTQRHFPERDPNVVGLNYKYFRKALMRSYEPSGVRMDQLFDLMQYYAGHHKFNLLWLRMQWFAPDGPFRKRELNYKMCLDLFRRTFLVVELADEEDNYYDRDPYSPANVADFDEDFRCKDFAMPDLNLEETIWTGVLGHVWSPPWPSFIRPKFRPVEHQAPYFRTTDLDAEPRDDTLGWDWP